MTKHKIELLKDEFKDLNEIKKLSKTIFGEKCKQKLYEIFRYIANSEDKYCRQTKEKAKKKKGKNQFAYNILDFYNYIYAPAIFSIICLNSS